MSLTDASIGVQQQRSGAALTLSGADLDLLRSLCAVPGASGDESQIADYVRSHLMTSVVAHRTDAQLVDEEFLQDAVVLILGRPSVALYVHLDTVGYAVSYERTLVPIGHPRSRSGDLLAGISAGRAVEVEYIAGEHERQLPPHRYHGSAELERGTVLTYKPTWSVDGDLIHASGLDNRAGVFIALELAASLKDVAIVFTTAKEHGSAMTEFIGRHLFDRYRIFQALILDTTWATSAIHIGGGPVVSARDSAVPRQAYVRQILEMAQESAIEYQLEVALTGVTDGAYLQRSGAPIQWTLVGPAQVGPHQAVECISINDILQTTALYQYLVPALHARTPKRHP